MKQHNAFTNNPWWEKHFDLETLKTESPHNFIEGPTQPLFIFGLTYLLRMLHLLLSQKHCSIPPSDGAKNLVESGNIMYKHHMVTWTLSFGVRTKQPASLATANRRSTAASTSNPAWPEKSEITKPMLKRCKCRHNMTYHFPRMVLEVLARSAITAKLLLGSCRGSQTSTPCVQVHGMDAHGTCSSSLENMHMDS